MRYARYSIVWMVVTLSGATLFFGCAAGLGLGRSGSVPASAAVRASIPVGEGPTLLALSPDGSRLFAASNQKLSVVDTTSNSILSSVQLAPYREGLAVTPDGSRALLTTLLAVNLTVFDTKANAVVAPIKLFADQVLGGFSRIAVTPDSQTAYVANAPNQVMAVANLAAADTSSLLMDMAPFDVAITPNGRTVYIAGCKSFCATGTIEALDTGSRQFTSTSISVGSRPYRLALSPDGTRAYTANLGGATISVVDLAAQQVTATISVAVQPTGIAVSRDGKWIYVASQPVGTITVIDATTNTVVASAQVADNVREVVVTPDGRGLYVSTLNAVLAVDVASLGATP